MTEGRKNRLIHESSPYLLQHADNPVDWYPWGPEAFERARAEDKPVMLSVGYSACHWCHVMERESFADAEVARLLNDGFVCVKVDREERPDVDEVYMAATVAMSGHGGWPMTVFMNAEGQPFFAGTYFPKHDGPGRIGLCTLLARIGELWQQDRARLEEHGRELARALAAATREQAPKPIAPEAPARAVRALLARFDSRYGGFGQAPKFPPASTLRFLLELYQKTREPQLLAMVRGTLDGMKNGGIYDHVGGGFCRYSTDERWLVPHFEKMLYDNAQLASVYLDAFQVTKDPEYERVARETLDYAAREMQDAGGGYYSATDADSEGEEGKFYVFYYDELLELLGPELGALFAAYYGATPEGNWEGKNVLNTPRPLAELAERFGVSEEIASARLAEARARVYERRRTRVPPALDDKILASWNGLMIGAMAEGARVLGEPRYLRSAERAAEFVAMHMRRADGGLYRSARHGRAKLAAYLEDYAFLGDGLLSLYEAGGGLGQGALGKEGGDGAGFGAPEALLLFVKELAERLLLDFEAKEGGFYHTAHAHERLLLRPKEGHDGALPSANAVAARLLARLSPHLDWRELRDHAARAIESFGATIERAPEAFPTALGVLERLAAPPTEIVVVGERGAPDFAELASAAADVYLPFAARVVVDARVSAPPARRVPLSPLTRDKKPLDGRAALYVCHDYRCEAPIDDASAARAALTALAPGAPSSTARTAPRTAEPAPRFR